MRRRPPRGALQRFLPGRLPEVLIDLFGEDELRRLRYTVAPDQGFREPLLMVHVVETETSLDAETPVIRRAVASFDVVDLIVLDIEGEQAADAAVGTGGGHLLIGTHEAGILGRHERARRAGLHAFPAGDAGAHAHRIIEVEDDLRMRAAEGVADHIVDLFFAAGPYAAVALDAGVEIHRDGGVRQIGAGVAGGRGNGAARAPTFPPSDRARSAAYRAIGLGSAYPRAATPRPVSANAAPARSCSRLPCRPWVFGSKRVLRRVHL